MVSLPDFDPNRYWQAPPTRFNRNTLGTYELGSLFKLFTVAMALDAGVVDIADAWMRAAPLAVRPPSDPRLPRQAALAERARGDRLLLQHRRRQDGDGARHRGPARLFRAAWACSSVIRSACPRSGCRSRRRPGGRSTRSPRRTATASRSRRCRRRMRSPGRLRRAAAARPSGRRGRAGGLAASVSAATAAKLRWLMWLTVAEGTGKQAAVPGLSDRRQDRQRRQGQAPGLPSPAVSWPRSWRRSRSTARYLVLVTPRRAQGRCAHLQLSARRLDRGPTVGPDHRPDRPVARPAAGRSAGRAVVSERLELEQAVDGRTGHKRTPLFGDRRMQVGLIPIWGSTDAAAPATRSRADGYRAPAGKRSRSRRSPRTRAPYARAPCLPALPGSRADGGAFIDDALARGAAAVLSDPSLAGLALPVPLILDANPRRRLALMAARLFERQPPLHRRGHGHQRQDLGRRLHPADLDRPRARRRLAGHARPGRRRGAQDRAILTTPDPVQLYALLAEVAAAGIDHLVLEASSHGLDQHRLDGVRLSAAAFPISPRPLRLSRQLRRIPGRQAPAVQRAPAVRGCRRAQRRSAGVRAVGRGLPRPRHRRARLRHGRPSGCNCAPKRRMPTARSRRIALDGASIECALLWSAASRRPTYWPRSVWSWHVARIPRLRSVHSPDCAACAAGSSGSGPSQRGAGVRGLCPHPGRARSGARCAAPACRRPSDRAVRLRRRSRSGQAAPDGSTAAARADQVFVTDDNPRSEDPAAIRRAILAGCSGALEIGDRRAAIRTAVAGAGRRRRAAGRGQRS